MNCRMTRGIYLRANGEINCYCSTGEQISLTRLPLDNFDYSFVTDFYFKDKFKHIRESIRDDKLPFPKYCLKCNYLAPFDEFDPDKVEAEIEWAHIEAASICNLRCPFCVHGIRADKRKYTRVRPKLIPWQLYTKVLEDIRNAGLNIKWMYFSGRGEPGLHPDLWKMVESGKEMFDTNFLVNTNGNISYDDMIVDSGLDKIKIAVESLNQKIYGRYRINGTVDRILDLTQKIDACKKGKGARNPEVIWQRVMFNFNDSYDELIEFQKKAIDYGVDTLKIVYTWTENFSTRRPGDFPKIFPNIEFLDTYDRDNMSVDILRSELENTLRNGSIASTIALSSKIFHWFELGTANRDEYDEFAGLSIGDERLYARRKDDPLAGEYISALRMCLHKLSELYAQKRQDHESSTYLKLA